jgi:hypothetical protein
MIDEKQYEIDHPIAEIRKIRDEHAAEFNGDLRAMFADIKRFAAEQKLKMVSPPPKQIEKKTGS